MSEALKSKLSKPFLEEPPPLGFGNWSESTEHYRKTNSNRLSA